MIRSVFVLLFIMFLASIVRCLLYAMELFLIIRAISDKADDSAHMDYPTFEKAAAEHSAKLVEHMIQQL